jgi:hypothetical protein
MGETGDVFRDPCRKARPVLGLRHAAKVPVAFVVGTAFGPTVLPAMLQTCCRQGA